MADRKISDLTALTTPASGDYLPIVDISEASAANKNKRITIEELLRGAPDGTAGAPGIAFESDPNTGLYSPGADALGLVTGGTERARIDSSGRLLVGTSSARSNFDNATSATGVLIEAASNQSASLGIVTNSNSLASNGGRLILARSEGTVSGSSALVVNNDKLGIISYQGHDGTEFVEGARIAAEVDGTPGANDMPGRLVFSTTADGASSPTERLRIDGSGRLLLGTSTNTGGSLLQVNDNRIRIATAKTPASATDTGSAGEICWDTSYIYVCTATNTWKRAALSTW